MSNIIPFPFSRVERNEIMNQEKIIQQHVLKETKESFSKEVERIVVEKRTSYLDAVQFLVEEKNIEPESVSKLLTKDIYIRLEIEAENLSLIKKTKNRLDI